MGSVNKKTLLVVLLLLAVACCSLLPGCAGSRQKEPAEPTEAEPAPAQTGEEKQEEEEEEEQKEERPPVTPRIGPLLFDPAPRLDASGVYLINGPVNISVEAPGAWKVEFYITSAGEAGLGTLLQEADPSLDRWEARWEPPLAGEAFKITALAYFNGETVQSSAHLLWPKEEAGPGRFAGENGKPYLPLNPQSKIQIVEGLPRYFRAGGWANEHTIFGLAGTTPVLFDLETGKASYPGVTAWSASLSPRKDFLAYTSEGGVYVVGVDGSNNTFLWPGETAEKPIGDGYFKGGLWSPGGDKLLVWFEHEWDSEFFIVGLEDQGAAKINTRLDGYFLTAATGWADERNIVFTTRANMMKDGTREYTFGYRSDLAVYNLETQTYRLISDTTDGEFIEGLSAGPAGILFLRWFAGKDTTSYGVMDPAGRVLWEEPYYQSMNIFLAPDGQSVACLVENRQEEMNVIYELVIRPRGGISKSILELPIANYILPEIFWHPNARRLLFTFVTTLPRDNPPGSYQDKYYTLVVEP